jgi:predicted ATPase
VTGDVVALTRGLFEFEEAVGQSIRGTDETYKLFELVAKAPEHLTINTLTTPFLNRESILAAFDQMLVEATARPIVHRIEGEAGYGKTRLVLELARRAEQSGFRVVEAKGVSHLFDVPYFSVRMLVLRLLHLEDQERAENLATLLEQALDRPATLTPMDRTALLDILGVVQRDPAWEALNPPERRVRLSQASVTLWRSVVGRIACLLIVEDLHWMDEPSLEVLGRIVAAEHSGPFLAIVTHRMTKQISHMRSAARR